jgi:UDP-N-acetylmuramoyl-L-alanyl-D-glutamate--2,6-diaminopimelate ligase
MNVQDLISALGPTSVEVRGDTSVEVQRVDFDSRRASAGSLFCCVRGAVVDGHEKAGEAIEHGSVALLVDRWLDVDVPQLRVDDVRVAMAQASAAVWGHPSRALDVVGITGTNGKTTTTFLLRSILEQDGRLTEVLGTLSGARTTPEAPDLQAWLATQRDAGTSAVAMEVSSHALALHRVDGTRFAAAVFTNLSRDHLDFHETMESYFEAKARLFDAAFTDHAVVNLDDPYGRLLRDAATVTTVGYGFDDVEDLVVGTASSSFRWHGQAITMSLGGRFNVSNALAAATAAHVLGVADTTIAAGLSAPVTVPGRFQSVEEGQPFAVIVDYAHTPDALQQVLRSAREIVGSARVLVVFGCGGDRDATKRPAMGEAAAQLADVVFVTADNSRHEETQAIIAAVKSGFDLAPNPTATDLVIEEDREAAIGLALAAARPGDVVVLAGKGHETTQTIGDAVVPFDDAEVARRFLHAGGTA